MNSLLPNDIIEYIPFNNNITQGLDIESMKEACKLFIGEHDFYSFAKRDATMSSTFRTIISCEILLFQPSPLSSEIYYLKIIGKGFLRYMVRYIIGALFALGKNKLCLSDISDALENHKEEKLSARAKPHGLHLIQISY